MSIKEERIRNGMTQTELAEKLNVTQGAVVQWESGKTNPNAKRLRMLSELFGCTIDELLKTDEP